MLGVWGGCFPWMAICANYRPHLPSLECLSFSSCQTRDLDLGLSGPPQALDSGVDRLKLASSVACVCTKGQLEETVNDCYEAGLPELSPSFACELCGFGQRT